MNDSLLIPKRDLVERRPLSEAIDYFASLISDGNFEACYWVARALLHAIPAAKLTDESTGLRVSAALGENMWLLREVGAPHDRMCVWAWLDQDGCEHLEIGTYNIYSPEAEWFMLLPKVPGEGRGDEEDDEDE